jgi:hypothetical protein
LSQVFELHVVTARQHKVEDVTRKWIERFFPGIFKDVHFGNHYSTTSRAIPKSELCRNIGAALLIDDSARYAEDCAINNIPCIVRIIYLY